MMYVLKYADVTVATYMSYSQAIPPNDGYAVGYECETGVVAFTTRVEATFFYQCHPYYLRGSSKFEVVPAPDWMNQSQLKEVNTNEL